MKRRSLPLYQAASTPSTLYLSENSKTGVSVNFPIIGTCQPTKKCIKYCYAGAGMLNFSNSIAAQMRNLKLVEHLEKAKQSEVDQVADTLYEETVKAGQNWLRWNGVGDLMPGTIRVIKTLALRHEDLTQWIISRKPDMIRKLPDLKPLVIMVSLDGSEDEKRSRALIEGRKKFKVARYRMAYVKVRDDAVPAPRWAYVVFNEHQSSRRYGDGQDPRTCPATIPDGAEHEGACDSCRRCFK